ncbi:MAG: nicotinate-nucleotide adenylyltransferase [Blastocatellia bacterium]
MSEVRVRQRIAIYGGTFDPIHNGHWQVAKAIMNCFAMDRLLFVPAFVPPHKRGQQISSPFHRLAMLAVATMNEAQMFVSPVEVEAPERPYTVQTLDRLKAGLGNAQLFFVMGADSFRDVTTWREHQRLLSEYDVIVATRPGYQFGDQGETPIAAHLSPELQTKLVDLSGGQLPSEEDFASPRIYLTDYVEVDVSATDVREIAQQGKSIVNWVPPAVAAYIEKYKLYQKP